MARTKYLAIIIWAIIGAVFICGSSNIVHPQAISKDKEEVKVGYNVIPKTFDPAYIKHVEDECKKNGVEPVIIFNIIKVESNWDPKAVSPGHDSGLMQLNAKYIPFFITSYGDKNKAYKPAQSPYDNVELGIRHFKALLITFQHDYIRAIVAYNAGQTAVKTNKIPQASIVYLKKVLADVPSSILQKIFESAQKSD